MSITGFTKTNTKKPEVTEQCERMIVMGSMNCSAKRTGGIGIDVLKK